MALALYPVSMTACLGADRTAADNVAAGNRFPVLSDAVTAA